MKRDIGTGKTPFTYIIDIEDILESFENRHSRWHHSLPIQTNLIFIPPPPYPIKDSISLINKGIESYLPFIIVIEYVENWSKASYH